MPEVPASGVLELHPNLSFQFSVIKYISAGLDLQKA